MTTITSFDTLKIAIRQWYKDRSDVDAYSEDFIALAEQWIEERLRVREMVATTSLTPTAGTATLPTDYLSFYSVSLLISANERKPLDLTDIRTGELQYRDATIAQESAKFTIVGTEIRTYPHATQNLELVYYQRLPKLGTSAQNNWLLTRQPNLYLRAALKEAAQFFHKYDESANFEALADMMVSSIQANDEAASFQRAGMHLVPPTPSPEQGVARAAAREAVHQ
ncbi:hypothetical protein [Breoghania sp.]|uniref:phage adaptor protein n=1 Tax=Breoghania sp. TaxID=2065378 RepID=UPI002622D178|nr:hypothetical protein [Breoghania sp.]MDJ0933736.1 hypothetical protein [Breoghania sp.]